MLKNLITTFAVVFSTFLYAQSFDKTSVERDFSAYNQFLIKKDFKNALNYTNEGMFKYLPKKGMIQLMEQSFKNPVVSMNITDFSIQNISDELITVKNVNYVKIKYLQNIRLKFLKKDQRMTKEVVISSLEKDFGKGNVQYDSTNDSYKITAYKNAVAHSKDLQRWKFAVIEKKMMKLLQKFLPKEVL